jgi:hypothetical protein
MQAAISGNKSTPSLIHQSSIAIVSRANIIIVAKHFKQLCNKAHTNARAHPLHLQA